MIVDLQAQSAGQCYQWMTQAVVPRPIAWILTENDGGDYNLAPFSYFNALCSAPPLIGVSLSCKPDDSPKDTLRNIRARGKFVAHVAAAAQLPMLNESSAGLDYGDSELSRLGLKPRRSAIWRGLRIARWRCFAACIAKLHWMRRENKRWCWAR